MPMRDRAEMCHEALLSRHLLKQENNVKITDLLGGSNIFATLSQALANNTSFRYTRTYASRYGFAFSEAAHARPNSSKLVCHSLTRSFPCFHAREALSLLCPFRK